MAHPRRIAAGDGLPAARRVPPACILITGMSGTGKSTVVADLARRGYRAFDFDDPAVSHEVDARPGELTGIGDGKEWEWDLGIAAAVLDGVRDTICFVSGCSPNQSQLYDRFDRIVLLTAPPGVIVERLRTRTTNDFGKDPQQLANTLALIEEIEPLLRRSADLVIETTAPLDEVIARVLGAVGLRG